MSYYNGVIDNENHVFEAEESESSLSTVAPNNTSIEGLLGFDRTPEVRVERMNISPYLLGKKIYNVKSCEDLTKFTAACAVTLVREDLEALKDEICNGRSVTLYRGSPKTVKCRICNKVYFSEKKLQNHLEKKHMIVYKHINKTQKRVSFSDKVVVHELQEYHKCRKCTCIFETYKLLKKHMRDKHKKRKCYICHYCSKNFVDRMFFKVHIKLHCEVCGLLLKSKTKCLEHMRTVCSVPKYYRCKTCNSKFLNLMHLKEHSYEHTNTCYVCDICKSQFVTKCGIVHHISYLHSENRPNSLYSMHSLGGDRVYQCNFCEISTVDKYVMKEHVDNLPDLANKAMTGYKDYYFCDQCMEKFDTETNLLQHKWTHFLSTSHNSQERRGILAKKHPIYKYVYKMNEELPELLQPRIVLENLRLENESKEDENTEKKEPESIAFVDVQCIEVDIDKIRSPLPKVTESSPKKISNVTILSDEVIQIENVSNAHNEPAKVKSKSKNSILTTLLQKNSEIPKTSDVDDDGTIEIDLSNITEVKKAIVDPKSKKTLLSRHQCQICFKYLSSNYCLKRHMRATHEKKDSLQCHICEETFVWKSLLESHKCIRLNLPEMPFEDARPEIHFDNLTEIQNGNGDYQYVDLDITEPVVEICEDDSVLSLESEVTSGVFGVVMQEVPIEF